jgi:hypothetical protein
MSSFMECIAKTESLMNYEDNECFELLNQFNEGETSYPRLIIDNDQSV